MNKFKIGGLYRFKYRDADYNINNQAQGHFNWFDVIYPDQSVGVYNIHETVILLLSIEQSPSYGYLTEINALLPDGRRCSIVGFEVEEIIPL